MKSVSVIAGVRAQSALVRIKQRARDERGEIGSTLILMAILVGAAVLASTVLRGAIADIVGDINTAIRGQDAN